MLAALLNCTRLATHLVVRRCVCVCAGDGRGGAAARAAVGEEGGAPLFLFLSLLPYSRTTRWRGDRVCAAAQRARAFVLIRRHTLASNAVVLSLFRDGSRGGRAGERRGGMLAALLHCTRGCLARRSNALADGRSFGSADTRTHTANKPPLSLSLCCTHNQLVSCHFVSNSENPLRFCSPPLSRPVPCPPPPLAL